MTARAARGVVDNVINTTGLIQASSVSVHNGEVILDAGEDGTVAVSGTIDASGRNTGESGGTIAIRGKSIAVADDASLSASGDAGGGTILIGGKLPDGSAAQSVAIGKSVIAADATGNLYFANTDDPETNHIAVIDSSGRVTPIPGVETAAPVTGLSVDAAGNLHIIDGGVSIRRLTPIPMRRPPAH